MAKSNMIKRLIGMLIAIVIAFSFSGCQSLQAYKADAISQLVAYSELDSYLGESIYTGGKRSRSTWKNYINGPGLDEIVNEGKISIDNASNKTDANKALNDAIKAIDAIPIWWKQPYLDNADALSPYDRIGFVFWLKIFDVNGIFECTADLGGLLPKTSEEMQKKLAIKSGGGYGIWGEWIYSVPFAWYSNGESGEALTEQAVIDVILKLEDGTIIGYVVIEIFLVGATSYTARLLKSVINQKVGGQYEGIDEDGVKTQYQAMDEEEVKTAIKEVKEKYKNEER